MNKQKKKIKETQSEGSFLLAAFWYKLIHYSEEIKGSNRKFFFKNGKAKGLKSCKDRD